MSSFREIIAKRVSLDGSVSSDTGRSILSAANGAAVRTVIDAAAGTHTHVMGDISNITIIGSAPFPAHDVALTYSYSTSAWVARTIGLVGVGSLPLGGWPSGSLGAALADKAATASPVFTGVVTVAAGSAGAPALTFTDDTDTGIYRAGVNSLAFGTNGTERIRIGPDGEVGIGMTGSSTIGLRILHNTDANNIVGTVLNVQMPASALTSYGYWTAPSLLAENTAYTAHIHYIANPISSIPSGSSAGIEAGFQFGNTVQQHTVRAFVSALNSLTGYERYAIYCSGSAPSIFNGVVYFAAGTAALPSIAISSDTNTGLFAPSADNLAITTGGTERLRVDSGGKILVGATTSRTAGPAVHPALQMEGTNAGSASFQCIAGSGQATVSPQIILARHRGGIGGSSLVQDGDTIGTIRFNGGDDTDCISNAAVIECRIDGTPGSNDMPGVLIFSTTADGSATSTERMRITSSGNVGIGTSSPSVRFHVSGNSRIDGSLNINNAFTLPTTDGTNGQVLSTNGSGTVTWQTVSGGGGGGISDGDKGDITVSGSGATWTIDSGAVSYAKIQNVSATDRILGRSSAGAGVVEEIACTAAGRALIDDADAAAQRTTLGLGTLATQSVEIIHPFLLGGM